jgi:hypothetical protein
VKPVFIVLFAANVGLSVVSYFVLPDRVASHFGAAGRPNGWMSNAALTATMVGTHTLLFVVFLYSSRLLRVCPPSLVSLPNRDFWLSPENRPRVEGILDRLMAEYGVVMFLFMLLVGALVLQANLAEPVRLNERPLLYGLGALLAYTVYWCVKCFRSFRRPAEG